MRRKSVRAKQASAALVLQYLNNGGYRQRQSARDSLPVPNKPYGFCGH